MQPDILSQEEIDVLLHHKPGDEQEAPREPIHAPTVAMPYDFTTRGAIALEKIPSLDLIYNRFVRLLSQALSGFLTRLVDVELYSSDIITFGEFIRTLPLPASLHVFTMRPLHGPAVMALDSALVFAVVERLFGGSGRTQTTVKGREFTLIEQRVISKVARLALGELQQAWEPVYALKMQLERTEANPQLIAVIPARDMVLLATLEVHLEDIVGFIRVCIPYGLLQPIKNVLDASFNATWTDVDQRWIGQLRREMLKAEVEVVVELGEAYIDTQQFLALNPGEMNPSWSRSRMCPRRELSQEPSMGTGRSSWLPCSQRRGNDIMSDADLPRARKVGVLLGLPVEIVVELGATVMTLGDLLRLGPGSTIELGNKVDEPLQMLINGKKIGEGEAMMVRQSFALRIQAVLNRAERLQQLGT
ncbi:MAG: flagellar motor switch protein FliM [Nitrospinae bacterium]|nr:flagellar motor switch protein FliM [Nitrospinota bacterium]